jgi:hypothetical protein
MIKFEDLNKLVEILIRFFHNNEDLTGEAYIPDNFHHHMNRITRSGDSSFIKKKKVRIPQFPFFDSKKSKNLLFQKISQKINIEQNLFELFGISVEFKSDYVRNKLLDSLIYIIMNEIPSIEVEIDSIKEICMEISNKIVKFSICDKFYFKSYYFGVFIKDPIILDESIIIRSVKPRDFRFTKFNNPFKRYEENFHRYPSAIIEFFIGGNTNQAEFYLKLSQLLNFLLLIFDNGIAISSKSTGIATTNLKSNDKTQELALQFHGGWSTNPYSEVMFFGKPYESYQIDENNSGKFVKFYMLLKSMEFDVTDLKKRENKKFVPILVAYNRYRVSFHPQKYNEEIISNLISGLEALFTENKPQLTRSLKQRFSILMKSLDYNHLVSLKIIAICYSVRSKFMHGEVKELKRILIDNSTNIETRQIILFLRHYLRIGIAIQFLWLEQKQNRKKQDFLLLLDQSIFDDQEFQKLKDEIRFVKDFANIYDIYDELIKN